MGEGKGNGNGGGPVTWDDMRARRRKVLVGDVELVVREMVLAKWGRFAELVATAAKWDEVFAPLAALPATQELTGGAVLAALIDNLPVVSRSVQALVRDLIGTSVPEVAVLAVDYPENDAAVVAALRASGVELTGEAALRPAHDYALANMTPRQAVAVLDALVEVNDFSDLLGKSAALGKKIAATFRARAGAAAPLVIEGQ